MRQNRVHTIRRRGNGCTGVTREEVSPSSGIRPHLQVITAPLLLGLGPLLQGEMERDAISDIQLTALSPANGFDQPWIALSNWTLFTCVSSIIMNH